VEVEGAERARAQSIWILNGALDWARLILREDARKGGADHLGEPWAVPLAEARLSTFLAAEQGVAQDTEGMPEAFLSGQIVDLQSRLNVSNLLQDGKIHAPSRTAFARLFDLLNLPAPELTRMLDGLTAAQNSGAADAQKTTGAVPLWPQDIDQLAWFGLSAPTIEALRPFVTVLPQRTTLNLNTASAEAIYASVDGYELADAHHVVKERSSAHFSSITDANQIGGKAGLPTPFKGELHDVTTSFFEVRGQLRLGQQVVQQYSLVQRQGLDVKTLWRRQGAVQLPGSVQ
jgi:general secretion pathway protein K